MVAGDRRVNESTINRCVTTFTDIFPHNSLLIVAGYYSNQFTHTLMDIER